MCPLCAVFYVALCLFVKDCAEINRTNWLHRNNKHTIHLKTFAIVISVYNYFYVISSHACASQLFLVYKVMCKNIKTKA